MKTIIFYYDKVKLDARFNEELKEWQYRNQGTGKFGKLDNIFTGFKECSVQIQKQWQSLIQKIKEFDFSKIEFDENQSAKILITDYDVDNIIFREVEND